MGKCGAELVRGLLQNVPHFKTLLPQITNNNSTDNNPNILKFDQPRIMCYPCSMINPVLQYRQQHNISQQHLADQCDLSLSSVRRVESGTLASIPASLPPEITDASYQQWKRHHRNSQHSLISDRGLSESGHPFAGFCTGYTVNEIAELLLVPHKTVASYLTSKRPTVPRAIEEALRDSGYQRLSELKELQRAYAQA